MPGIVRLTNVFLTSFQNCAYYLRWSCLECGSTAKASSERHFQLVEDSFRDRRKLPVWSRVQEGKVGSWHRIFQHVEPKQSQIFARTIIFGGVGVRCLTSSMTSGSGAPPTWTMTCWLVTLQAAIHDSVIVFLSLTFIDMPSPLVPFTLTFILREWLISIKLSDLVITYLILPWFQHRSNILRTQELRQHLSFWNCIVTVKLSNIHTCVCFVL